MKKMLNLIDETHLLQGEKKCRHPRQYHGTPSLTSIPPSAIQFVDSDFSFVLCRHCVVLMNIASKQGEKCTSSQEICRCLLVAASQLMLLTPLCGGEAPIHQLQRSFLYPQQASAAPFQS